MRTALASGFRRSLARHGGRTVAALAIAGGIVFWKDPRQAARLREALTSLKGWTEKKFTSDPAPVPVPVAKVEVPPEKPEIPKPAEPTPISRNPFGEKIGPLIAAGNVTVLEAEWLQASLKGTNGEAEKALAETLFYVEVATLGQWRARTACAANGWPERVTSG